MSLNDPHWGRGSDEPQDTKKDEGREETPAGGRNKGRDDYNDRDDRNDRDDASRNARGSRNDRGDRYNRDNRDDGEGDELDRLWRNFTDMINDAMGSRNENRRREDLRSQLKSRDDFSYDDDRGRRDESRDNRDDRYDRDEDPAAGPRVRPEPHRESGRDSDRVSPLEAFRRAQERQRRSGGGGRGEKRSGFGAGVFLAFVVAGWAASGFYIVPEGQTGVVTTFGRYAESTMPGFHWHMPAPVQSVQLVDVSSVRTTEIGGSASSNRLREALMLTDDENIVDVQFTVQYRIKPETGAKDYLFNTRAPDTSVVQAAESAMREVVGRKTMDSILFESKAEIAEAVKASMQSMLDRYSTGIEVMSVAIQNAQPPQPVQAAFNDAVKAGQDRERSINLGEAYMNAVLPKAQGTASRLKEEAEGYKARVVETAAGDADRFKSVYAEYKAAPEVTRDRLYIDAMREVFSNVSKIYVGSDSGNNLLYLPLDKIVSTTKKAAETEALDAQGSLGTTPVPAVPSTTGTSNTASAHYETEPAADIRDIRSRIR